MNTKNLMRYALIVVVILLTITTEKTVAQDSNNEFHQYWYEIQSDSSLYVKGLIKIQAGGKTFIIPQIQEGIKGINDTTTTLKFSWRGDGVLIINIPKGTRMHYVKVNPKNLRRAAKWYAKYAMGDMKAPHFGYRRILRKAKAK